MNTNTTFNDDVANEEAALTVGLQGAIALPDDFVPAPEPSLATQLPTGTSRTVVQIVADPMRPASEDLDEDARTIDLQQHVTLPEEDEELLSPIEAVLPGTLKLLAIRYPDGPWASMSSEFELPGYMTDGGEADFATQLYQGRSIIVDTAVWLLAEFPHLVPEGTKPESIVGIALHFCRHGLISNDQASELDNFATQIRLGNITADPARAHVYVNYASVVADDESLFGAAPLLPTPTEKPTDE